MKKDIAEKWVKALRSGEYNQTHSVLKDGEGFCCLGVLCDISGVSKWERSIKPDGAYFYGEVDTVHLPYCLRDWSGVRSRKGEIGMTNLAALNDAGKSFSEIADIIEKNWEEL